MTEFRSPHDGASRRHHDDPPTSPTASPTTGTPTAPPPTVRTVPPPPTTGVTVPPPPAAAGITGRTGAMTAPSASAVPRPGILRRFWSALRRALHYVMLAALAYGLVVGALIVAYRWVDPPASTLILVQRAGGTAIRQTWVPLERMSPSLVRAVIMSEDARFCSHGGIDWREIEQALEQSQDGIARGGSTISMQVAKNLFLWPSKSYLRKALEIPETLALEAVWSKRRTLEIYLNIAEWGPGVFGAEAAARYHFDKSANRLNEAEAALLAVALPNPIQREAGRPGPGMQRLAQIIQGRMRAAAPYVKCVGG